MAAIGVALTTCVAGWDRPVILHGSVLYCDVPRTLAWLCRMFPGAVALPFDVTDGAALDALVAEHRGRLSAVYVESAANPTGDMPDWAALARAKAAAPQARIIVDNTWLSPAAFNPFRHGADVVVESGSKYLSGGHHIWGHVTAHNNYAPAMIEFVCTYAWDKHETSDFPDTSIRA
jgi:cystathionine beta-lyase/cystathionine gamma-synthase